MAQQAISPQPCVPPLQCVAPLQPRLNRCYLRHTLQDVPGVAYGTIPNRADGTLLKIIPKSEP